MEREVVETIKYCGHMIEILTDDNPWNPREESKICIFHIAHNHYCFGDENYNDFESIKAAKNEAIRNGDIVSPLYMFDHSGITISLSPFSCPWDSGQVGFVQVPRKIMIKEFGTKIFTPKLKKRALKIMEHEVSELDSYIKGEAYGYVIDEDGDSCWGYIGDIKYCIEEAKGVIDYIVKNDRKEHCEQIKKWIKNKVALIYRKSECLA